MLPVDVEFISADLRDGGQDALAELDLSDQQGDGLVRIDLNPRADLAHGIEIARQARLVACRRLRQSVNGGN